MDSGFAFEKKLISNVITLLEIHIGHLKLTNFCMWNFYLTSLMNVSIYKTKAEKRIPLAQSIITKLLTNLFKYTNILVVTC